MHDSGFHAVDASNSHNLPYNLPLHPQKRASFSEASTIPWAPQCIPLPRSCSLRARKQSEQNAAKEKATKEKVSKDKAVSKTSAKTARTNLSSRPCPRTKVLIHRLKAIFFKPKRPTVVPAQYRTPLESDTESEVTLTCLDAMHISQATMAQGSSCMPNATTALASMRSSASAASTREPAVKKENGKENEAVEEERRNSKGKGKATDQDSERFFDQGDSEVAHLEKANCEVLEMHDRKPEETYVAYWKNRSEYSSAHTSVDDIFEGLEEMEHGYVRRRERCEVTGVWKTTRAIRGARRRVRSNERKVDGQGEEDADVSPLDLKEYRHVASMLMGNYWHE